MTAIEEEEVRRLGGKARIDVQKGDRRTCGQESLSPPESLSYPRYRIPLREVGTINRSRCAGNHWGSRGKKTSEFSCPPYLRGKEKTSLQAYPLCHCALLLHTI